MPKDAPVALPVSLQKKSTRDPYNYLMDGVGIDVAIIYGEEFGDWLVTRINGDQQATQSASSEYTCPHPERHQTATYIPCQDCQRKPLSPEPLFRVTYEYEVPAPSREALLHDINTGWSPDGPVKIDVMLIEPAADEWTETKIDAIATRIKELKPDWDAWSRKRSCRGYRIGFTRRSDNVLLWSTSNQRAARLQMESAGRANRHPSRQSACAVRT